MPSLKSLLGLKHKDRDLASSSTFTTTPTASSYTENVAVKQDRMSPTAIAKVGGTVIAEATTWEEVEGNIYVCPRTPPSLLLARKEVKRGSRVH